MFPLIAAAVLVDYILMTLYSLLAYTLDEAQQIAL